ncbi:MAG: phosphoribosylformylglycinamidine synthase subunit PurS [Actinomycetota bacterium]|nr:phosphoribosylformylglycinamidine synthase subunit PurS [Actinomycetota bacterium]
MTFEVLVEVRLLAGIADPQGATIERSLPALGFAGVSAVRVGKAIRFCVDAPDAAAAETLAGEVTRRLLSNPVIEEATVTVRQPSPTATGGTQQP